MISCYLFGMALSNTRRASTRFDIHERVPEAPGPPAAVRKPMEILTFPCFRTSAEDSGR